jgi:hypothetical protein
MMRTSRPRGRRSLVLLTALSTAAASISVRGADRSFEPQSTLGPQIAPQTLSIDASIASMVRRGLLVDVKPTATPRGRSTSTPAANSSAITPTPTMPVAVEGWRAQAASNSDGAAAITPTPATLGWRPAGQAPDASRAVAAPPALAAPTLPTGEYPDLPADESATDAAENPLAEPATESPSADDDADDAGAALDASAANASATPTPRPSLVAARPQQAIAEPTTSDDPLPDDHLAPIDALPETPAPTADAPGDPREPEFGDEDLEGTLAAPSTPRAPAAPVAPPSSSSLSGQAMTPVGEPDRIEQPDENVAPPSNTENYQDPDDEAPPRELKPLTRNQIALRDKVRRVLKYYYSNPLNTGDRSPWEVMHCMLSYEVHSRVLKGGPQGPPITAVGWLCFNQPCKGRTLMYLNEDGDMRVKVGPALQGHHGQLLALLAQARVRADYPMKVEGHDFTVADLIEMEKSTCYPKTELTFQLIGLQRYLDIDAKWTNDQGMAWDFPTLLREEMRQPVRTAACGGCHRLAGLILTVKKRERSGKPVDGEYAAAKKFVANYVNYAYRLQNSDGSFSTDWFKGPGAEEDIDRRLKTTGHQLEFLIYAAEQNDLNNFRMVRAVNFLSNTMWANRGRDWEAGPLGHAIHSLVLYDRLAFAPYDDAAPTTPGPVAQQTRQPSQQQTRRARR